jgi:hypothetical protein
VSWSYWDVYLVNTLHLPEIIAIEFNSQIKLWNISAYRKHYWSSSGHAEWSWVALIYCNYSSLPNHQVVSSQEKTRNQVFSNADKGIGVPDLMFTQVCKWLTYMNFCWREFLFFLSELLSLDCHLQRMFKFSIEFHTLISPPLPSSFAVPALCWEAAWEAELWEEGFFHP